MKKILFTISFIILAANLRAQETTTDQIQDYKEYDFKAAQSFYLEGNALWKYPFGSFSRAYYDTETKEYLGAEEFIEKYGELNLDTLVKLEKGLRSYRTELFRSKAEEEYRKYGHSISYKGPRYTTQLYRWKLNPTATVVGGTLIGVSFAAFAVNAYANDDIDSQKTVGYVCAGVSVVGAICIIAGLHKEYYTRDGFKLANGLSVNDNGGGITITKKF